MNNPFFNRLFPYTNLNDINLDWILKKLKSFKESLEAQAADVSEALVAAQHADATATSACNAATNAQNAATVALDRANSVQGIAADALATAQAALDTAEDAESTADAIAGTANNALTVAQGAQETAANALTTAQDAVDTAQAANATAGTASADANNAEQTAQTAINTAQAALAIAQAASGTMGISGADEDELIKIGSVDADGVPQSWEIAEKGVDYPDPATYGITGLTVSNNPNIGIRNYSVMLVFDGAARPLVIPDTASLDLLIGNSIEVGSGTGRLLIGTYNAVSNAQKNSNPNLASIFVPVPNSTNWYGVSGISGTGATACGMGVNARANGACAFGANQLVNGTFSFTAGQMNYVSGRYAGAIGRLLEAKTNDQFVVGLSNDNKSTNAFEVGNGTTTSRSNAFYVTKTGTAIAKAAIGIEDGNGGTVEITAAQLQALLALLN